MASEARVQTSLQIKAGNVNYLGQPTTFTADVIGRKGPTPGAVTISTGGTNIDLSQLVTPGLVRLMNLDPTNYVEWGIFDPGTNAFYPLGEILPGESYVHRFSRNFAEAYAGAGTGTTAPTNRLRFKANHAACDVLVEAFEA